MGRNIYVTKSYLPPRGEYDAYLDRIWESRWLTNMGRLHEELRERLKEYLRAESLELFTNGHLALEMALQALELPAGGEIVTTPFSFASTTHAIVRQGFTPVFCDVRPGDGTLDPDLLESLITDRTCAIVPVHVYGNVCDDARISAVAARHGLKLLYDAAHTFGETVDGRSVCTLGDISMLSFHATKVFHTIEGGALVYPGGRYDDILYKLKNFGITGQESVEYVGGNAKMTEFQAAMGLCNLDHTDELTARRGVLDGLYRGLLAGVPGLRLLERDPRVQYNYAYMPVVFDSQADRDGAFALLAERGIHARKYFYPCINAYDCYRGRFDPADTPEAKKLSEQVLTLPLYADLDEETVREICEIIHG